MRHDRMLLTFALLLAAPLWAQESRSLGDVAREVRAERVGTPRAARVITNEDLPQRPAEAAPAASTEDRAEAKEGSASDSEAKDATGGQENGKNEAKTEAPRPKTADELRAEREEAYRKQNEQVNKTYTERISKLREQINAARLQLAKLATAKANSMEDFRRSVSTSPAPGKYEAEQRAFDEQIAAQQDLINSLNAQLEDAMEAARHAGVPHPGDL